MLISLGDIASPVATQLIHRSEVMLFSMEHHHAY